MTRKTLPIFILSLLFTSSLCAQHIEKVDTAAISKLKREGMNNSEVMNILSLLTDVHGPRLTNSPGYKKAADYARETLTKWGLENVHFDVWNEPFGRGWQLKKFSLQSLDPVFFPVIAHPKAWSPGIRGTVQAEAVYLDIQKEEDIKKYQGKLKGKFVMFSLPTPVKPGFTPDATRLADSVLLQMANSSASEAFTGRRFSAPSEPQRLAYLKWDLCQKEGVVAVLEASPSYRLEDGTITVAGATVPYPAEVPFAQRVSSYSSKSPKILPQVVVSAEHYNRMVRQIKQGLTVKLEMTLETEFTPEAPGVNVIAEIPGTDLKDEVVMIGAHLDSWHSGTGATDNACGSAVMMEAMRLIKSLGVNPRRTIRIALWSGEEQGLLGSRNYVKRVLGERLDKVYPYDSIQLKPAAEKFSVYFNMDNGSGKYRGIYMQGNQNVAPVFRAWFKPFEKMGAATLTLRNTGGTDHLSFDALGLPAFQFIQDPIEYGTRTHHTSMDVYDKAVEGDLKHNAVITAAFAWLAANRDELIPRK
jgi:carboxypeptidase Q